MRRAEDANTLLDCECQGGVWTLADGAHIIHVPSCCRLRLAGRLLADVRGLIGCLPGRMRCSRGSLLSLALRLIEGVLQRGGRLLEDDLPLSECLIDRFLRIIDCFGEGLLCAGSRAADCLPSTINGTLHLPRDLSRHSLSCIASLLQLLRKPRVGSCPLKLLSYLPALPTCCY